MTGLLWLDWATQAVSLFNVILLVWLGLTVLLNAERRTGGILLAACGLLMGGAFFISHSAILGHDADVLTPGQDFWWYLGWAPVVSLPLAWYLVMLWYTGFWESRQSASPAERRLYLRQRVWLGLALLLGVLLVILLYFAHLLPSLSDIALMRGPGSSSAATIFPLALIYPLYALLCMGLALDALLRPGPSRRWLGEQARRRALPWLVVSSILLLVVSLLVGWVMVWILTSLGRGILSADLTVGVALFDLVISGLIGLSVLATGQATVAYEIFTARTLPRNGLLQHWRRAVILAAGYSLVVSGALAVQLRPVYILLLTTLLMTVFFALLAWRSFAERERTLHSLDPFLSGAETYTSILDSRGETAAVDVTRAFHALCRDILETRQACLAPLGVMAPLAGAQVFYPGPDAEPIPALDNLAELFQSPDNGGLALDPHQHNGFVWAIPLWSQRGLAGTLLLGEKRSRGLYTQEEIETARSAGERLIDLKASLELARRLAMLERQHLTHSQVMEQRARSVLHDEILPLVHAALIQLTGQPGQSDGGTVQLLSSVHRQLSDLLRSMTVTLSPDVSRLGFLGALRQVADRDLAGSFDRVDWQVEAGSETHLNALAPLEAEILFFAAREALRNAARYGRSGNDRPFTAAVRVSCREQLLVIVEDNGSGITPDSPPAVLSEGEGSGQGLALHSALMAAIGGSLALESEPGGYTRVVLTINQPDSTAASATPPPSAGW